MLTMPGCVGVASELIEFDEQYRGIVENLLGRTVIAENLDAGIEIMRGAACVPLGDAGGRRHALRWLDDGRFKRLRMTSLLSASARLRSTRSCWSSWREDRRLRPPHRAGRGHPSGDQAAPRAAFERFGRRRSTFPSRRSAFAR
ncbi:MAG: hypothetical protein ACLUI3_13200 [Christensenellales bacterium]